VKVNLEFLFVSENWKELEKFDWALWGSRKIVEDSGEIKHLSLPLATVCMYVNLFYVSSGHIGCYYMPSEAKLNF